MSAKKIEKTVETDLKHFSFSKKNYTLLLIGIAINVLGFLLMIGGGSHDPNVFHEKELFSFQRIRLAPFLVIAGYVVMGYSIMKNPFKEKNSKEVE